MTMRRGIGWGIRDRRRLPWALATAFMLALMVSCASGPQQCQHDPVTGSDNCSPTTSSGGEAAATAVIAAGAWVAAGCTVNGCLPPYTCNSKTKQCERIRCDENKTGACPPAYNCDPVDHLCK